MLMTALRRPSVVAAFLATMSHEIRTLMNAAIAYVDEHCRTS